MFTLQPAQSKDFATIEHLARHIWEKHYVPIIGTEQVNYMLNKMYSHNALEQQTREGQNFHLVVKDNKPAGFIAVSGTDNKNYFLHKFYILQDQQNSGIGTAVFKKVFGELYKPESIRLTVNRQNYKSVNFYFKLGFKIEKVEDFDIGNGYFMNDFVMLWKKD